MAEGDATPDLPDPSLATIRAIDAASQGHGTLVNTQLQVLREALRTVEREARAERDGLRELVMQRLDDIDRANVILAENVNRVPTQLQTAIVTLKELENVKFDAVQAQAEATTRAVGDRFDLLDEQTVREKAAADLALAAAFDAQKEAAAAQNNANTEMIRKSELGTAETIKTNAEAQRAGQQSLSDKIDDLKDRLSQQGDDLKNQLNQQGAAITAIQTARTTTRESHTDQRSNVGMIVGLVVGAVGVLSTIVTIVAFTLTR